MLNQTEISRSFITHSFLLKGEEPPVCIGCDKHLTIEHILFTCSAFIEMRESHFTAQSCCFRIFRLRRFFNFLREINIFEKI